MDMMSVRRRVLMGPATPAVPQPIYHIENVVCDADFYQEIPELRTGSNGTLYLDDWSILIDLTPTKLYKYPFGAYQAFNLYVNWSGMNFYNTSNYAVSKPWQRRHKMVITHKSTDGNVVYAHADLENDGVYAVTACSGNAIRDDNSYALAVGWDYAKRANYQFVGTIHDMTVYHGYIPSIDEIKTYIGVS